MQEVLGRCLGPMMNEGNEMCQAVLIANGNGTIVPHRSPRHLRPSEFAINSNETEDEG